MNEIIAVHSFSVGIFSFCTGGIELTLTIVDNTSSLALKNGSSASGPIRKVLIFTIILFGRMMMKK